VPQLRLFSRKDELRGHLFEKFDLPHGRHTRQLVRRCGLCGKASVRPQLWCVTEMWEWYTVRGGLFLESENDVIDLLRCNVRKYSGLRWLCAFSASEHNNVYTRLE
jgi:hypothetical protein